MAADAFVPPADARERKLFITSSSRCGECHVKMWDEWQSSAHAKAASSPLYKAAVASAHDPTCDRCHAPIATEAPKDPIAAEGVTCDVCHTLREPVPSKDGGSWRLAVDDMVKYGPRCDLKDHYFHRMGCSPEHKTAEICGACHWWEPKGLPVFTEYADWKAGPQAAEGMQCQSCHMPKDKASLAEGSPVRTGVPHHGLLGEANDLRARALGLEVSVAKGDGDKLDVHLIVRNNNAGHAVPAGLPEHRVVVRVRVQDKDTLYASQERELGRHLVDEHRREVPFWQATRVDQDDRITVGGTFEDTLHVAWVPAATLEVEVTYRPLAESIAKQLGVADNDELPMVSAKLKLGGAFPKTVTVKAPPPGKRPPKKK